ncbi:MAG TPA: SURF1 family cytochrome oxidase biogenesis protein [Caulobacteraceae bacterium]|nr:SURF1 family cytochrome oxidase biogenesis protein [Caulobacteraceae bacterium]
MTSEQPRFPVGLTAAVAVVFAICLALGFWQLQRAAWKAHELARITALKTAPPQPIGPVLAAAAAGGDASFTRVSTDCAAGSAPAAYHLTTDNGDWIARARANCRLADKPYDGLLIDRGFLAASRGATSVPGVLLPPPVHVEGVLYRSAAPAPGLARPAPYILAVERETPSPPGVRPAPFPDAAGNLEYVGSYAPTWFGLAGVVLAIYAAMLWRREHPKR